MDNIPQDVLYEALERHADAAERERVITTLYAIAGHHRDHAAKLTAMRKKGHQSASRELIGVADHIRAYAEQLAEFVANNPVGTPAPPAATEPHPDAVPGLPGNTGRCAAFRRATQDDPMVCELERGHADAHGAKTDSPLGFVAWPRRTSTPGQVCGDVVIRPDGSPLNCQLPFGHIGAEHSDGSHHVWPRGIGTSRPVSVCETCNTDSHVCHGCGELTGHSGSHDCLNDDGLTIVVDPAPGTVPPCGDREPTHQVDATSCMLPKGHTGKHIGYTGARWEQAAPAATLGDIAEQAKMTMIPGQRETVEDVEREMRAENAVIAAVMVAEMKEQVSAAVGEFTMGRQSEHDPVEPPRANGVAEQFMGHAAASEPLGTPPVLANPFAPPQALGSIPIDLSDPIHGGPTFGPLSTIKLSGSTEPQTPAVPTVPFLPPHLVPGAPRERYSVSSVQAMADCGLKFRLKYRDGIADTSVSWANVGGTAFHAVVRTIEDVHANAGANSVWTIDGPVREQESAASALWKVSFAAEIADTERKNGIPSERWRASAGGKEGYDWWLHSGEEMARKYVHHRRRFLAEGWALLRQPNGETAQEIEFDVSVDGVMNKGFIDSAWINTTIAVPTIRVRDWKSGSKPGDDFQLKTYGHALRALGALGDFRVEGSFYNARKGEDQAAPLVLTPDDDAEVSYQFHTTQELDRAGLFIARPSSYCGGCPVRAACPIMASKR